MSTESIMYVTSSRFKQDEANELLRHAVFPADGVHVGTVFSFAFKNVRIEEPLEVDLTKLVRGEVREAYRKLLVPCIVEHAGLIFEDYVGPGYPGGLTKPMWDTLGASFLTETNSGQRRARARAVVAYCDGMTIETFHGETPGTLSEEPRGEKKFYWDTIFIPDSPPDHDCRGLTYAEIVDRFGLPRKLEFSQSSKALLAFLSHRRAVGRPKLWG
ncbi:MAG: hypothetical protein IV100_19490 [Myxococcales bacterium]|nr:hypothetical protein [Myxococcales bacterium]